MHCGVHPPAEQFGFQFLGEEALAADFGQGSLQQAVALGGDQALFAG